MHQDHNPIVQRIDEMRTKWKEKVKDKMVFVRWLLKAADARMYEGFCRLEASPHGLLEEIFVFFYTPFENAETFSRDIIHDWIEELNKNGGQASILQHHEFSLAYWNNIVQRENGSSMYYDGQLIRLMEAFRKLSTKKQTPIVLSLLPRTVSSAGGYGDWINRMMQMEWMPHLRILVFDQRESDYHGRLFEQNAHISITLNHDLRMNDAIREIATGGDPERPDVQFRRCMYEMGDAAAKKQLNNLHIWGKKAINTGIQSGQKDLLGTAYITYAAMLFSFREHGTIHMLLDSGIRICKNELSSGNKVLVPLLLQFYGYKGACHQQQKDSKAALEWFMRQGSEAAGFALYTQSVSGYYKAFLLAQYNNFKPDQVAALSAALNNTPYLRKQEIESSEYPFIAYEYVALSRHKMPGTNDVTATVARNKMDELYGEGWQPTVEKLKQNFSKKQVEMIEAFPG